MWPATATSRTAWSSSNRGPSESLRSLPVEDVHGVGPVTARELAALDIETAGDLAAADPELLAERFGERGRESPLRPR